MNKESAYVAVDEYHKRELDGWWDSPAGDA